MKLQKLFFASLIVLSANTAFAQADTFFAAHTVAISIPNVALLDLETTGSLDFALEGAVVGNEAGLPLSFETANNSDTWINYSSIIGTAASRKVTVIITSGTLPLGLKLTVSAAVAAVGKGDGAIGISTTLGTPITLSESPQDIITTIGSAYTGDGAGSGHQLTYQLESDIANYANLDSDNIADIAITYTLLDM